ncbi:NAD-dependent succinate-semialdehyde dehydrogenase [Achromobacter sp. GG226]|uniref:NAD-dependent succinate-semialdehyde dehydrogenase n=1 Tax=Verticiella alkaliphila TaxID=2779529 RepID=UPI001C0AF4A6|nr:NAD-dependent succinate-semialdehyde dehydrogenase [Verticiella sp. GG226]MBU4610668.1 NAD-dependent succinate-semialdehyde dehydrogenase [Verticiella sp. GG226]
MSQRLTLSRPDLLREACLLGDGWYAPSGGATLEVMDPYTGETLARVPSLGAVETETAIAAAEAALAEWSGRTAKARSQVLRRWSDLMLAHQDDLGRILTAEQGKPLAEAKGEIAYAASFLEWFAEEARRIDGEIVQPTVASQRLLVLRQPIGVCAAITPWNFPAAMITRKVGPALAAGCTMIVKPAEATPLTALALGVLALEAGVPAGVFQVITGQPREIGETLTASHAVRKLSFTGSTQTGRVLMRQSADTIKKLSLELGGNAPLIVFEDADIDAAVAGIIASKFRNAGQTCVCANRVYVHDSIYDDVARKLVAEVEKFRVGDGMAEGTTHGPLINEAAVRKVEEHIADALAHGAKVLTGGTRAGDTGTCFTPTVLADVPANALCAREETFGPVAPLFRFTDEADVVRQANDTIFGLAAYIFTRDQARTWRVGEALEYGMVGVNTGLISNEVAPFGGVKQSGLGREGSRHGIEEYLELKYLCVQL